MQGHLTKPKSKNAAGPPTLTETRAVIISGSFSEDTVFYLCFSRSSDFNLFSLPANLLGFFTYMEEDNCSIAWAFAGSSPEMTTPTAYQFQIPRKENLIQLRCTDCGDNGGVCGVFHDTNLVARAHPSRRRRGFLENRLCAIVHSKVSTTTNRTVEHLPNECE